MCSVNRSVTAFLIRVWWACHYFFFIWFLRVGKWILYSTLPNPILTQNFSAILSIDHMLMHGHKTLYTQIQKPRSKRGIRAPFFDLGERKRLKSTWNGSGTSRRNTPEKPENFPSRNIASMKSPEVPGTDRSLAVLSDLDDLKQAMSIINIIDQFFFLGLFTN